MFTDARVRAALDTMVHNIDAPAVPLLEIRRKVLRQQPVTRYTPRYRRLAIAVAAVIAVIFLAFPSNSMAIIQNIETRYRAALRALGGIAPPPVPESLRLGLASQNGTLATAQSRVTFTIVPPAGLPHDVVSSKIQITPTGVYSKTTHSWHVGPREVTFIYRRADGGSFVVIAEPFDLQSGLPSKYMFEAKAPAPDGRPILVKHEHFAWRNGNQMMSATEGDGISAAEIEAIRVAMRGIALPRRALHAPDTGTSYKAIILHP